MSVKPSPLSRRTIPLLACVMLFSLVFISCPTGSSGLNANTDEGVDPETGNSDTGINLKFDLPSETWAESVTNAKLSLYNNEKSFYDGSTTYSFDLGVTKTGTITTIEGTCLAITAGTYIIDVKLKNSSNTTLRRHLGMVDIKALSKTTTSLDFKSAPGMISLGSSNYSTIINAAATATISLCDSNSRKILRSESGLRVTPVVYVYDFYGSYCYSILTNVDPGTYSVYWEIYNANGTKLCEGAADSVVVTALADTKKSMAISESYGSLTIGNATFTD